VVFVKNSYYICLSYLWDAVFAQGGLWKVVIHQRFYPNAHVHQDLTVPIFHFHFWFLFPLFPIAQKKCALLLYKGKYSTILMEDKSTVCYAMEYRAQFPPFEFVGCCMYKIDHLKLQLYLISWNFTTTLVSIHNFFSKKFMHYMKPSNYHTSDQRSHLDYIYIYIYTSTLKN